MCLAVPAVVVEIVDAERCRVDLGGIRQEVATSLLDDVAIGDYVIVHVGFALGRLDRAEAERTLALLEEALPALPEPVPSEPVP